MPSSEFDYDVAFSFAGEDRAYVHEVAEALRQMGIRVFFDTFESVTLWGKDLYQYLDEVYRRRSKYCVIFLSRHYAIKAWPQHELKSAQAHAFRQAGEFILPARFDHTEIPGLRPTVGYIDLSDMSPGAFALLVQKKVMAGAMPTEPADGPPEGMSQGEDESAMAGIADKAIGTRFVETELPLIVRRAQISGILPTAVFIDIDDLTVINKKYGRPVGDTVLDTVFQLVRKRTFAKVKYYGRCGDDTFYAILFSPDKASDYCSKLRGDIASYRWGRLASGLRVTCTMGYASINPLENPYEWLTRAIQGMTEGKGAGRGKVYLGPAFSNKKYPVVEPSRAPVAKPVFSLREHFS